MTQDWQGGRTPASSPSPAEARPVQAPYPPQEWHSAVPADHPDAVDDGHRDDQPHRPRRRRRWPVAALAVLLVLALAGGSYLLVLSQRWSERSAELEATARDLGAELARARADLEETSGTLALVESQLDGAQQQIHELADAVAQTGDDREVQRQVADYQAQVSAAATAVADAMDQCIDSQEDLIDVLEEAATALAAQAAAPEAEDSDDPDADTTREPRVTLNQELLDEYRSEVAEFCQAAQDANTNLQRRLEDS